MIFMLLFLRLFSKSAVPYKGAEEQLFFFPLLVPVNSLKINKN